MPAMIEIANAEKTFTLHLQGGVRLPVVRAVNFDVHPGECVVLSGPSGAGKSSILKMALVHKAHWLCRWVAGSLHRTACETRFPELKSLTQLP